MSKDLQAITKDWGKGKGDMIGIEGMAASQAVERCKSRNNWICMQSWSKISSAYRHYFCNFSGLNPPVFLVPSEDTLTVEPPFPAPVGPQDSGLGTTNISVVIRDFQMAWCLVFNE